MIEGRLGMNLRCQIRSGSYESVSGARLACFHLDVSHGGNRLIGRGIDLLQSTMPHFFDMGLVSSPSSLLQKETSPMASSSTTTPHDEDSVYSRTIRLTYTPPAPLPPPFPRTLNIEGKESRLDLGSRREPTS